MSIQSTCQDIVSMCWNFIDTAINYSSRIVFRKVNLHKKGTKLIRAFEIKLRNGNYAPMPAMYGAMTSETMDISLMRMFIDGPDVSLNGSPTVSPVTEALCASDPL